MIYIKTLISAVMITLVTTISGRYPKLGALVLSLPITSIIVFVFMKFEGKDDDFLSKFSVDTIKMIIPSFILFAVIPLFIKFGFNFYLALILACILTMIGYYFWFKFI